MTAEEMATCWVPVPMRWRNIEPGDVIHGRNGLPWLVAARGQDGTVGLMQHADQRWAGVVDPDEAVTVLLPAALRDAMELTRDELGARLLERRGAA